MSCKSQQAHIDLLRSLLSSNVVLQHRALRHYPPSLSLSSYAEVCCVNRTRRYLLEWQSFLCHYIPVGLLEVLPQRINDRPAPYYGRNDLETLMASDQAVDWVKISELLLGPVSDSFEFMPKHKANAHQ